MAAAPVLRRLLGLRSPAAAMTAPYYAGRGKAATCFRLGGSVVASRFFSSPASSKVGKTLAGELQQEKEQYEQPGEIKEFLQGGTWQFEDADGDVNLALVREAGEKRVRIEWQLQSPYDPDEDMPPTPDDAKGEADDDANRMEEATDFSITVEGNDGESGLSFYCSTQAGEGQRFVIGNVASFGSKAEKESVTAYQGPEFDDLDEKVQEALDEYLAELGITDAVCDFIDASALDKEQREYLRWLGDVKKFVHGE